MKLASFAFLLLVNWLCISADPVLAVEKIYLPIIVNGSSSSPPRPAPGTWLAAIDEYRALANLPPVGENSEWSDGNLKHARYMVKNDVIQHDEDPAKPWYTAEGQTAARHSNLSVSSDQNASDLEAIDSLLAAPFHALGILDPRLNTVGFGSYREADGGWQMGMGIDILRGVGPAAEASYPVIWPGNGTTVHLTEHCCEYPDPLTSCPGYRAPAGLPLIVQLGSGSQMPKVTASAFTVGGQPLEHCVFDEGSYTNPDGSEQQLGRAILNTRDAVVLIPRAPLKPGATYTASLTVDGQTHTWSFTVDGYVEAASARTGQVHTH